MNDSTVNNTIQNMINEQPLDNVIRFVKGNCQTISLTPRTLGMLFEAFVTIDDKGYSEYVSIDILKNIHPGFQSTNGCQWARSDGSYLGKKYFIKRQHENNRVSAVKLNGFNDSIERQTRRIRPDIYEIKSKEKCVVLNVGNNIEVDHKNGRYNDPRVNCIDTQLLDDFQAMTKAANDAKRQHCKRCIETGLRFDARVLGYKDGWIVGEQSTPTCMGCFWYDPKRFNEIISKDFIKTEN